MRSLFRFSSASLTEIPEGLWLRRAEVGVRSIWASYACEAPSVVASALYKGVGELELKSMTPPTPINFPYALFSVSTTVPRGLGKEIAGSSWMNLFGDNFALWLSSTMKKRAMKMNKHKLKKRRKALRMNTKKSKA